MSKRVKTWWEGYEKTDITKRQIQNAIDGCGIKILKRTRYFKSETEDYHTVRTPDGLTIEYAVEGATEDVYYQYYRQGYYFSLGEQGLTMDMVMQSLIGNIRSNLSKIIVISKESCKESGLSMTEKKQVKESIIKMQEALGKLEAKAGQPKG